MLVWLLLLLSPVLHAQYTASDYLNWTKKHLDRGNCDDAKETYALYKEKVPQGNAEVERRIAECGKELQKSIPAGYVDLGLPSGTLWKNKNEEGKFYTYDEAVGTFGSDLPNKKQFEELISKCRWTWTVGGYKVVGPNGNYIVLPVVSFRGCEGDINNNSCSEYWSLSPSDKQSNCWPSESSSCAWTLYLNKDRIILYDLCRCIGASIRLVRLK